MVRVGVSRLRVGVRNRVRVHVYSSILYVGVHNNNNNVYYFWQSKAVLGPHARAKT